MVRRDGFYRTPAQLYWLALVTVGIYAIYYLIRERRLARRRLGWSEETYWTAFKLIIPIYGIFYYFESWALIGDRVKASGVKPWLPLSVQIIPMFLANLLWRLPADIWVPLYLVSTIFFGTVGISVAQAERTDEPEYAWPRLGVAEWIIGVLCSGFFVLILVGAFMDDQTSVVDWNSVGIYVLASVIVFVVFQIGFGKLSRPRKGVEDPSTSSG